MPRTYKSKNVQTKPEKAGEQNMSESYIKKQTEKDDENVMGALSELFTHAVETSKVKGTNWKEDDLIDYVNQYFQWTYKNNIKPAKAGLALYLGCSRETLYEWETNPQKYGAISDIIKKAFNVIESQYIQRSEKYPTANIFLLKTSHGHVETSKVDINDSRQNTTNADEVNDIVKRLGLDSEI
jgi:hypothetical protein